MIHTEVWLTDTCFVMEMGRFQCLNLPSGQGKYLGKEGLLLATLKAFSAHVGGEGAYLSPTT